jgi:hypothetical protein
MRLSLLSVLAVVFACAPAPTENKNGERETVNADGTKTARSYYKNKKVKSESTYKDGKRNGMSRSYNEQGQVMLELPYVDDKRHGQSKRYYETGILYQTTEYVEDRIHGTQVKYRPNGKPMSEARFEDELPCLGLKEYLEDGTIKKKYPKLVIKAVDRIDASGEYILNLTMSEKVKKVRYYTGKLSPGGCLTDRNYFILLTEDQKTGKIVYSLSPGQFIMEELNIVAVVETILGNEYVTQQTYHVAIDNT